MNFIKELQEARMLRDKQDQLSLTYEDAKEKMYLLILILETMRNFRDFKSIAAAYSRKTVRYDNYKHFRPESTDLYNLIYFVVGDEDAQDKLKNPGAAKRARKTTSLPQLALSRYIRSISNLSDPIKTDIGLIQQIESALKIQNSDYKMLRRNVMNLQKLDKAEIKKTITRLTFAVRAKLADSDITSDFSKMVAFNNLEDTRYKTPEVTPHAISTDVSVDDASNYRFLVPVNTVPFVARFITLANAGRSVTGQYVTSYLPIISMINDIVKAGPVYIEQLKMVHQRAKRRR
jgi:hypothetical protein